MNCPRCGNIVQEDAIFCDQCGARLVTTPPQGTAAPEKVASPSASFSASQGPIVCPACGAENVPGELFCGECGTPLEFPEPLTTVEPPKPMESAPAEGASQTAKSIESGVPLCPACGAQVEPTDTYCYACGAHLAQARLEMATAAPPRTSVPEKEITAPAAMRKECPSCGARVQEGDLFCDFCGAALTATAAQGVTPGVTVSAQPVQVTGSGTRLFLVIVGANVEIPLPEGSEILVGREDPYSNVFPDVDLTPYGAEEAGVSRRHFKLTLAEGQYAIQDLGSTNYTWVNQRRLEPQTPMPLANGDEIRAGRLKMIFQVRA